MRGMGQDTLPMISRDDLEALRQAATEKVSQALRRIPTQLERLRLLDAMSRRAASKGDLVLHAVVLEFAACESADFRPQSLRDPRVMGSDRSGGKRDNENCGDVRPSDGSRTQSQRPLRVMGSDSKEGTADGDPATTVASRNRVRRRVAVRKEERPV
jgi:hypothetical protein